VTTKKVFYTDYKYTCRGNKGLYVYKKYESVFLQSVSVCDVGADKGAIRQWLPETISYFTIGYGENISAQYNLEHIPWPLENHAFDVVLCSDVLEHLENIHAAFDECCRISRKYIIISLPNPYADFMRFLYGGKYMGRAKDMKFYGLTPEPEEDRHRWFFSPTDAREFIRHRGEKNGFSVLQHDAEYEMSAETPMEEHPLARFFRRDLPVTDLECGTMWWILKNIEANE
jgi:SAM-dependent methyltransferase